MTEEEKRLTGQQVEQPETASDGNKDGAVTGVVDDGANAGNGTPDVEAPKTTPPPATPPADTTPPPSTPPAVTPPRMSSKEMLEEVNKEIARLKAEGESDEERLKRRRRDERWAAIGDGIAAIANLVGTARGAKNAYEGTPLSDRVRARYDKLKAERDANRQNYMSMAMNRYKILKGDEDAATAAAQHTESMGLKREELGIKRQEAENKKQAEENKRKRQEAADKAAADRAKETKENNDRNYELNVKRLDENKRHNGAMESISAGREARLAANGGSSGNKSNMSIRLRDGSVHNYTKEKIGAINGLAGEMAVKAMEAASGYLKRNDSTNSSHFSNIARALKKAKSNDEINAIVVSYISEFPSLDSKIRKILGIPSRTTKPAASKPAAKKKITGVNWNAR